MPTYTVELDGQKLDIQGNKPPTEADARQALSEYNGSNQDVVPGFENPMATTTDTTEKPTSSIKGGNAVALETGRGLMKGTGQLIADVGWVANGAGLFKNGIGDSINQYGKDLIMNAQALPETDLNGFVKGTANLVGSAAPMLATFAGGELLGAAKVGELATNAIGTLTNLKAAKYFSVASRAMGQGTLFGVVNAIDTASTMPEHTNMKDQINEIMNSGKSGFIAGATLTPLMELGAKVFSKYGEKAAKAYMVGITGSEQAAEKAMDLTREPGTYQAIMSVDPTKPIGSNIELKTVRVADITKNAQELQHENMSRQLDLQLRDAIDTHSNMKQQLSDDILNRRQQFETDQRAINHEVALDIADTNVKRGEQLTRANGIAVNDAQQGLQHGLVGNSQNLQRNVQSFDALLESSLRLNGAAPGVIYDSVIQNAPSDGFQASGLINKIKVMMKKEYGVDIKKGFPEDTVLPGYGGEIRAKDIKGGINPEVAKQMGIEPKWIATSRAAGGEVNPNAAKVSKYLTDTLLPDLEEKIANNNGVYTLDMLKETVKIIKEKGYEDGISNPGFASLDHVFRPNKNVGDLTKLEDRGLFVGNDISLVALKQAGMLDEKFYNLKTLTDEYQNSIRNSVENKAKSFGKDIETAQTLAQLEAHLELPVESNLRLSNNMQTYFDTNNKLLAEHENILANLTQKLNIQKNALSDELNTIKFNRTEERIGLKNQEQQKFLEQQRMILVNKQNEIRQIEALKEQYHKTILQEKFDREAALNEIRTVGSGNVPLGRIQRSFITMGGYSALFGHIGVAMPALGAATVLSPKMGIPIVRRLLKSSQSGMLKGANRSLESAGNSRILQRLLIGNALRKRN